MTHVEFSALVASITYKPDVNLDFAFHWMHGCHVAQMSMVRNTPDATDDARPMISIVQQSIIDFGRLDREAVLRVVFGAIKQFEMHELKEWFKVGGVCFENPHPDRSS